MPGNALRIFSRRTERAPDPEPVNSTTFSYRLMRARDLEPVHQIELLSYSFPWTKGAFRDCLRDGYETWLACDGETLAGYGVLFTAAEESHLLNLCTHPDYRRQQLARGLLQHLLERAVHLQSHVVYLEVRPSNRAALQLYRCEGFLEIGRRRNYYPASDGREDALVLARKLT